MAFFLFTVMMVMLVMMFMMVPMPMFVFMAFALLVMVMMVFVYHGILCFLLQRYTTPRATGLQLAVHAAVYGDYLA